MESFPEGIGCRRDRLADRAEKYHVPGTITSRLMIPSTFTSSILVESFAMWLPPTMAGLTVGGLHHTRHLGVDVARGPRRATLIGVRNVPLICFAGPMA